MGKLRQRVVVTHPKSHSKEEPESGFEPRLGFPNYQYLCLWENPSGLSPESQERKSPGFLDPGLHLPPEVTLGTNREMGGGGTYIRR